jgi:hypothetical protein
VHLSQRFVLAELVAQPAADAGSSLFEPSLSEILWLKQLDGVNPLEIAIGRGEGHGVDRYQAVRDLGDGDG